MPHIAVIVTVLTLAFLPATVSAADFEVRFREQGTAAGKMIRLGEIADLFPAGVRTARLASRTLHRSPSLGRETALRAEEIRAYLRQTDAEFQTAACSGAETVVVSREGMTLSSRRILGIIDQYLIETRESLPFSGLDLRFQPSRLPQPLLLPRGELEWSLVPGDPGIVNSRSFTLIFRVDGEVAENIAVRGEVKATAPVLVAAVDLPRGTVLNRNDLRLVPADLSKGRNPCQDADEVIGKKLTRALRAGDLLDRGQVDFPPLVKRGEVVSVCAGRGALRLSANGVARSDGRKGDTIRVKNSGSGKDILCRVTGPGQAKVDY